MARMATIPFRCETYPQAKSTLDRLESLIFTSTRGDYGTIEFDGYNGEWWVVVHTGNILGMVRELEDDGFL